MTHKHKHTRPLPDGGMYPAMRAGHRAATGHALRAHLGSDDRVIWEIVRECCPR